MDDSALLTAVRADPCGLVARDDRALPVIDEIRRVPELVRALGDRFIGGPLACSWWLVRMVALIIGSDDQGDGAAGVWVRERVWPSLSVAGPTLPLEGWQRLLECVGAWAERHAVVVARVR